VILNSNLISLINEWQNSARNRFRAAEQEKDEFGKRFIEHGAMCYFNCSHELRKALALPLLLNKLSLHFPSENLLARIARRIGILPKCPFVESTKTGEIVVSELCSSQPEYVSKKQSSRH
jgi:hypothetical protein